MFSGKKLIARYVVKGALPYVLLSLVLLTAILFTQQAGRFAELALYTDVPLSLAGEIAAALLPSVLILTLPVAVLAGIVIGYARMGQRQRNNCDSRRGRRYLESSMARDAHRFGGHARYNLSSFQRSAGGSS